MPAYLFWLSCSLGGLFPAHFSVARGQLLTTLSKGRPPGKALVFSLPIRPR